MAQMPGFTGLPENWLRSIAMCARATFGDGILLLGWWALGRWLFGEWRWFIPPRVVRYAVIVAAVVVTQAVVEIVAVRVLGLWGYRAWQPIVPPGVGLFAILQAVVLVPLIFAVVARWECGRAA